MQACPPGEREFADPREAGQTIQKWMRSWSVSIRNAGRNDGLRWTSELSSGHQHLFGPFSPSGRFGAPFLPILGAFGDSEHCARRTLRRRVSFAKSNTISPKHSLFSL